MTREKDLPESILVGLLVSWERSLRAGNKSDATIISYLDTARRLDTYLTSHEMPVDAHGIRAFLAAERERTSAESSQKHYRNLNVYFRWLAAEGEIGENPMIRVEKPKVPEKVKPFYTVDEMTALLRVTRGQDFVSRRDHAIIRIFIDTGMRVSGLADLKFDPFGEADNDVFLSQHRLRVTLKGGDETWVPIGRRAVEDLDRYLRSRARNRHASSPWLWIGVVGHDVNHFGASGIRQMLARRGEQVGLTDVHPHKFRHTTADALLAAGATVDDVQHIMGWRSIAMPLRYAKGRGIARAAEAHRRLSPGDRL